MSEKLGNIIELFSAPAGFKEPVRPIVEKLELIKDHGIKDDKFAGKNLDKTVMIVGAKAYNMAKENGIQMQFGTLGENILFDFDPHELNIGDILALGDAQIQITENCSICTHLGVIRKDLPKLIKEHRGVYCKILKSGIIDKNSTASLLK